MNNCSRYRTPGGDSAEAGEPAYAVVRSKHYTRNLAQSTSRWHGRFSDPESPRVRCSRIAATANILSVARLPSERHAERERTVRPWALRPSLATGLPFRG